LYGWDQGRSAKVEDCGGCEAVAARDTYARMDGPEVTVHRATTQSWDESGESEQAEILDDQSEIEIRHFEAELEQRVARYAYYEIETPEAVDEEPASDSE
ncbi:MAG: hypothetical protein ACXW2T_01685, partial [Allosphingosinicella sp.]